MPSSLDLRRVIGRVASYPRLPTMGSYQDRHRSYTRRPISEPQDTTEGTEPAKRSRRPVRLTTSMVRRGSTVRVRQRASRSSCCSAPFVRERVRVANPPTCGLAEPRPSSRYAHSSCPSTPFEAQPEIEIYARLDEGSYERGIEVTDDQLAAVNITRTHVPRRLELQRGPIPRSVVSL